MISWFARNHVAANLLMVSIFVAGLLSLNSKIPLEVFPSIESDLIRIAVSLRGATPEDVEQGVSIRIEEAVQDLEGIERLTSRSMEGTALVTVEVEPGYDPREILADVKSRVDAISTLPSEAENPVISLSQHKFGVITVAVAGNLSEREIREIGEQTRDDLLRLPQITQAELSAVRDYEINITIPQDRLRNYQLTLEAVSAAIQNHSLDFSAGNVRSEGGDVLIRSKGQAYQRDEFEAIVVKTNADGSILRLGDIADVRDGFTEDALKTRFNGKPAALIDVYRIGNQSALDVAEAVRQYIDQRQSTLPQGLELSYWDDDSVVVKNRLGTLIRNAVQGGILVLALLTLFLRPSIAFWVFLGIPISFMGAFIFMPLLGVSLNILSLFGFILMLGIVVDDAIVTGENVYTHLRTSETGLEAAIRGTQEVAIPVTFGVLTTIVAFMPFTFVEGRRGVLFAQLALVVIPVLLFSLIESKFILPAHLKHIRLKNGKEGPTKRLSQWQQRFADGFEQVIIRYYRPLLARCVEHRYQTLAWFVGVLILILAIIMSGWTRFVFFSSVESETATATLTFPAGTPLEVTDRYVVHMADAARQLQEKYEDPLLGKPLITNILAISGAAGGGSSGPHLGQVRFETIAAEARSSAVTTGDLVREWRDLIGAVPGAESLLFRAEFGRPHDPIDIQFSGTSLATLGEIADKVKARLATYPAVFDIADSLSDGKEELQVELTEQGHALGLTRRDVIVQVGRAFKGFEAQRIQRGRDDIRVLVRFPINERESVANLENMLISLPSGGQAPLLHVATLVPGRGPAAINRIDQYRTASVTADINKEVTNMTVLQADLKVFLDELLLQYPGITYSLEGEAREQQESLTSILIGALVALFVIYCLLAIPFKSYSQPFIVMSVIPFGSVGAVMGHWLMGVDLSIMSVLGIMALIGVVVNDSLVLVDFINKRRQSAAVTGAQNRSELINNAILSAGVSRFRPIMLTSLTTFFGLLPLLFERSTQAKFLMPMAISVGFGVIFATFITLILVPVNYRIMEDIKSLIGVFKTWVKTKSRMQRPHSS